MAYAKFDETKPDASSQNGAAFGTSTRNNLTALRDMIMMGGIEGWDMTTDPADSQFPNKYIFTGNNERIEASVTWNSANQVTQVSFDYYPAATGGTADHIATAAFVYSSTYNTVTQVNWS